MSRYVSFRDFDWLLLIFVLMICGLGVMEIHSATMHTKFAGSHIRQVYWILGGVGAMFVISAVNYQVLLDRIHWFYIAASRLADGSTASSDRSIWERDAGSRCPAETTSSPPNG